MAELGMGCYNGTSKSPNRQAAARSMHPGGIQVIMVDGSVQWIDNFVELKSPSGISVWDSLNLSTDGQAVDANAF